MIRKLLLTALAVGLFAAANPSPSANAQVISVGRGGVHYNGYGRGYYGGYGNGGRVYSGYGNGPYGYGNGYGQGYYNNGYYNNGYRNSGVYVQPRAFYRPFGGGYYNSYGYGW